MSLERGNPMRMVDLIEKKRNQEAHTEEEIKTIIEGVTNQTIPDYQISAWLMAVYFQGMTKKEAFYLTKAMLESGDQIDLSEIKGIKVDKHSTGGVGDKTTLVLAPLIATLSGKMAKLSGRGLGHTGGTLDKLESIPGFNVGLEKQTFIDQVNDIGCAVAGQTAKIAPADKILYALRDVTGTVPSIPLIASSIMAKKLASGADVIVLDVKVGDGAFMKTIEEAEKLAELMVSIGKDYGKKVVAFLTNMHEPLGMAVGNKLEVLEAIDTLKGGGPDDFKGLIIELASAILVLSDIEPRLEDAKDLVRKTLESQKAYHTFETMVQRQSGNLDAFLTKKVIQKTVLKSTAEGFIKSINALEVGLKAMHLGAGRKTKEDDIDHEVGIRVLVKTGDKIKADEPLLEIYHHENQVIDLSEYKDMFKITKEEVATPKLVLQTIGI